MTLFYFFLALLLLVTVHESGHFLVARWCGVKVLRFSFGFGKILASWRDKRGTEFVFSLIPLGGYVKMLDEAESPVPKDQHHLAFNNQPIRARMAIVLAGPLFNLLFAFLALWLVLVLGITSLAPIINDIRPGSLADRAGLSSKQEILSFDGKKTTNWRDVEYALMPLIGTHEPVEITVRSLINAKVKTLRFPLENWQLDAKNPDVLGSLGITPFVPSIPPIIGELVAESPAALAGLQVGDRIISLNKRAIDDWLVLVDHVKKRPNKTIILGLKRNGQDQSVSIMVGSTLNHDQAEGFLGIRSQRVDWPIHFQRMKRESPINALGIAFKQTTELTRATFSLIGRLVQGKLPLNSLSGPVGIAQGAGDSARGGISHYLSFLALISISLGVLNLLPIPMLDGGQFLYLLIELIVRHPLSERFKSIGASVGFLLLVTLMMIALTNDISRLTG